MKGRVALFLCVFVLAFGVCGKQVEASGYPSPYWEFVFEDLGKIFIMTPNHRWWGTSVPTSGTRMTQWWNPTIAEWWGRYEPISVERMTLRPGLYYNVYPLVNIFYFDGYYRPHESFFSACGTFLAGIITEMPAPWHNCVKMLGIYKNGVLVAEYRLEHFFGTERSYEDLFRKGILHRSTGGVFWHGADFDPLTNILTIITVEGNEFTFDITAYYLPVAGGEDCCRAVGCLLFVFEYGSGRFIMRIKLGLFGLIGAVGLLHMLADKRKAIRGRVIAYEIRRSCWS